MQDPNQKYGTQFCSQDLLVSKIKEEFELKQGSQRGLATRDPFSAKHVESQILRLKPWRMPPDDEAKVASNLGKTHWLLVDSGKNMRKPTALIASLPSILPSLANKLNGSPLMSVHSLQSFHRPCLAKIVSLCRSWQISTKHCYRPTTSLFGESDFLGSMQLDAISWSHLRRCNKGPWSTISRWEMSLSFGSYGVGKCLGYVC